MADGGSVTVVYKADASPLIRETQKAKQEVGRFQAAMSRAAESGAGESMMRAATAIGVVGLAANRVGANLQELGDKASWAGRAGGFLANITQGNLVGAVKAAGQATQLTSKQVDILSSAWFKNTSEVDRAIAAYRSIGAISEETADKIRKARIEMAAGYALAYATFGGGAGAANSPDSRGGPMGPGARAFEQPAQRPVVFGLPIRNQVALEAARAAGDKVGLIKQIQRAETLLEKQLNNEKLTDKDRLGIYSTITALNAELTALTTKTAEAKKKHVAAEKKQLDMVQVQTASLVGQLGQGPFLSSPLFQFAQSYGYKAKPQDYVRDLREQVRDATRFSKNLNFIGSKGGSKNLTGELAGMGTSGEEIAAALARNPKLIRTYSTLADKRAAIAEKLQVQSMTVTAASVVVNAKGRIVGVDRNGNGQLEKEERFTVMNGGTTPRTRGTRRGGV